ncbi:hypothetical protein C1645_191291 [Glomus cerebriforme]|uniref:Galactose oxidase n=1 Tax=Glomus cerebriforme TaxID=658196 RepID=A0A397SV02_9GLOM|nr:hypothetical protein C1645_191291 [Glomus cerebriforme]
MIKNSLVHFLLWILIQLLFKVDCQRYFTPMQRHDHTATILDNKLYILGGSGYGGDSEFFYLDFSNKIDTRKLSWYDLSDMNIVPSHYGAASVKGGSNNDTLFLYGVYNSAIALVYTFDPRINKWFTPQVSGNNYIRKQFLTGVIDQRGKMYLFGETLPGGLIVDDLTLDTDMLILDTINLMWGKGSLVNAPPARSDYGATLLPNQSIIYIGCFDPKDKQAIGKIHLYDTITNVWSTKITIGNIPTQREYFSAVLGEYF